MNASTTKIPPIAYPTCRLVTPVAAASPTLLVYVLTVAAEHAAENVGQAARQGAAADRAHVGADPVRVVDLLADGDIADCADAVGKRGHAERDREARVPRPAVHGEPRGGDERGGPDRLHIHGRQHAVGRRDGVAGDHADERAEKAQGAAAPDAEADHGAQRHRGDDEMRQLLRLRQADAEQVAEGEAAEAHADQHDDQPGDLGGKVGAQRAQQARQRGFDQAAERGHPEREGYPARFHREERRAQIGGRADGGAEETGADAAARQALEHGPDPQHQHRRPEDVGGLIGREPGLAAEEQREHQGDRDDADVLETAQHRYGERRAVVDPVGDVGRFLQEIGRAHV